MLCKLCGSVLWTIGALRFRYAALEERPSDFRYASLEGRPADFRGALLEG